MARRFFYVCAGMLLLVASFQFGASSALGQSNVVEAAEASPAPTVVMNRQVFWMVNGLGSPQLATPDPIPGSSSVLACSASGPTVILANGECWQVRQGHWQLFGSFGGATSGIKSSWSSVKARYL